MAPKSKQKATKSQTSTSSSLKPTDDPKQIPNWPPLTPLIPTLDLTLTTLLPDQILLIPHFFTAALCKTYTTFLSTLPLTTTPGRPKRGEAVRVNDRFQTHDPTFANTLWMQSSLKELVTNFDNEPSIWGGEVLGLNPNVRVYRYRPGQFFDKHYDESNRLSFGDPPVAAKTTWTLLIYLSRCEGGETVFYPEGPRKGPTPEPVVAEVEAGMALLHRHGDDCLLHEGREVTGGEKWVLRSDLVVKR
jgi:2OG-Fe(II) oxygenase superfamily